MGDKKTPLEFVPYPTIQTTKINTKVFKFDNLKEVDYPVAPLISAKFYKPGGVKALKVRATLYINSDNLDAPVVEPPVEKDGVLTIKYDYDFSMVTPKTCDVWYVELDYTSPTVGNINKIKSFMVNLDPEISRGTTTNLP